MRRHRHECGSARAEIAARGTPLAAVPVMKLSRHAFAAIVAVSVSVPAIALATTFVLTDTADLFAASSMVVLGRVENIRSVEAQQRLRTNIGLSVDEVLKGPAAQRLNVIEPGGAVQERRRWIYGVPSFFVGERVLLFLHRNRRGELETTELAMGKFTIARSGAGVDFAVRSLQDAHVLARHGRGLTAAPPITSHRLHDFLNQLRRWEAERASPADAQTTTPAAEGSRWQDHFTFAGPPAIRWFLPDEGEPLSYYTSTGGDAGLGPGRSYDAVNAALAAWSTTGCSSLNLVDAGPTAAAPFSSCDGVSEISFNDPYSEIPDPIGCSGVLALGGVCADSRTPQSFLGTPFYRITEGDVMVGNGFAGCAFWEETNVAELLTHEIGHTLGMAHSSEDPDEPDPSLRNATMYYLAHFDGRGATLMSDDVAGICALYPAHVQSPVMLRRFAIVSGSSATANDRLLVDGALTLDNGGFDPASATLILDVRAGSSSVFRLAVQPGDWITNQDATRLVYRGLNQNGLTTLILSRQHPGVLRFHLHSRGLDLSGAQSDPVTIVLALGGANVLQATPALRTIARSRVYP